VGNQSQILVGGKWLPSAGHEVLTVVNPATEEPVATVPGGSAEDVDRAVASAAGAFDQWSQSSVSDRVDVLRRLADVLESRAEEITRTVVSEVGEPLELAARNQTAAPIASLRSTAAALGEVTWDEQLGRTTVHRAPAGVVAAITPWNVPLLMIAMKVGAAVAAGCTVVLKGSEVAPLTSFIFAEAVVESGLPAGVVNVVCGTGQDVGEPLVSHPLVDMVSLTGSVRAGRRVMELASTSIKRVALELGGKSASVVLEDADFEVAVAAGVDDAFRNSGQVCAGLTRMLVPHSRLREAEEIAAARARTYTLGDPLAPGTMLGPVTTSSQRDRVRGYIRSGVDQGARLVLGGPEAPAGLTRGWYVSPTVFSASNSATIAREEIFGPVVTIVPYVDEEDAVGLANDSPYGLAAAVWAADESRARSIATRLRAGRVRVNGSPVNPAAPHGGFKLSGVGRENGRYGIEEFLEYQSIG
jgi:aldehyde dehydrogenase (NAD+)